MERENVQVVLHVEGMTCTGCETRIEKALGKLEGIIEAKAIFSHSSVYVTYDPSRLDEEQIIENIEKLDYKVGIKTVDSMIDRRNDESVEKRKKRNNAIQLAGIGVIILALYLIINKTIGFNFIPEIDQSMGYGLLFVVGLLTSLHCIAMCGGINLSVCMKYKVEDNGSRFSKLKPSAWYNLGRVISYTVVGGLVGALGSLVTFSGTAKGIVAAASGIFMLIMGLNMLNIFPWLRRFNPRLPKFLGRKVHANSGEKGPLVVGLLNGLMPCGPLQAMQLYALGTGSFLAGALSMFLFSIGTVPLMFGFGAVSSYLSGKFTHKMMKVSAVLVMVLGIIMLNRGLNLSGLGIVIAQATTGNEHIARIENGVQYVTSELEPGSYSPVIVQKGIPVKWTIRVEKGDLNGCNNPITIPKYKMQQKLKLGDNIIEFTPEEEGDILYTCWMGMISSKIRVVSDLAGVTEDEIKDVNSPDQGGLGQLPPVNIPTDQVAIGEIKDGIQYVSIDINEKGYSPAIVILQSDTETVWDINGVNINSDNDRVYFPEYNAYFPVKAGSNELRLAPEADFTFLNITGELYGYVKVVENIEDIDIEAIKDEVGNYQPSLGSGGASCH